MRGKSTAQHIRLAGGQLVYEQWGSGPPLLLVHGLSGSARWWQRNIPALAPHFSIYAVDLIGFGGNRGRPLPLRESAHLLAAFVEHLAAGPAHVIAHSMGGQIAIHLAADHPQLVDHLVLAAASGLVQSSVLGMARRLPRMGRHMARGFAPTLAWDAMRAGSLNLLRAAHELLHDDVTDDLAHIAAPTLVVSGEYDALIPPELGAQQHAAIPQSRYFVLPGAGHVLMWDRADLFNELVVDFLLTPTTQAIPPRSVPPQPAENANHF